MAEKEKKGKKPAAQKESKDSKKPKEPKPAAQEEAKDSKKPKEPKPAAQEEAKAEKAPEENLGEAPPEEAVEPEEPKEVEEELTEEELRRMLEEQLERVTVAQMVQQMMVTLASIGYQKMGLPEEVNLKFRDLSQARLAIDSLDALLGAASGKMPAEQLEPFRGTLSNLKLNYVSVSSKLKSKPKGEPNTKAT